jgi:hypothetical protein
MGYGSIVFNVQRPTTAAAEGGTRPAAAARPIRRLRRYRGVAPQVVYLKGKL